VDIPEESITEENVQMTQKPRRLFTDEQKAEAVRIVNQSGKPVSQVTKEMGLTDSALRKWVKQAQVDGQAEPQGQLTTPERKELNELRRDLKRVQMERDFLRQYAQIIQGGESFIGLSEGLQNALHICGGVPKQHRTDSLSAAYRNMGGHRNKALTRLYDELCDRYRMQPTRNKTGVAHENGAIESPHGHLKNRIEQAIYLRGSSD
jgi:transposase-like protein